MDHLNPNRLNRLRTETSRRIDEYRLRAEDRRLNEQEDRDFKITKREYDIYKDRLDNVSASARSMISEFRNSYLKAQEHQFAVNRLLQRFIAVKPIKKALIDHIVIVRVAEEKLYKDLSLERRIIMSHADPDWIQPGRISENIISDYMQQNGLNPADFNDVLNTLGNCDISQSVDNLGPSPKKLSHRSHEFEKNHSRSKCSF